MKRVRQETDASQTELLGNRHSRARRRRQVRQDLRRQWPLWYGSDSYIELDRGYSIAHRRLSIAHRTWGLLVNLQSAIVNRRLEGRFNLRDPLQNAFSQNPQFLPRAKRDLLGEHVILLRGNLLEQAAINVNQNPERRLTVFGYIRDQ